MKILKVDQKNNYFEVIPDSFDDLWHIEKLIERGDLVSGESERKIKPKNEGEKAFKQKIFVELEVEKAEFHETTNQLRIQGIVVSAKPTELVELKSHHTIEAEAGEKIRITKKALKKYHIDRLERAKKASGRENLLLVVMDDEEAELAFLKDSGLAKKAKILGKKGGKRFENAEKGNPYFDELLKKLTELEPKKIVIAGPGFEKQNFEKFLKEKNSKLKPNFESTNSVGITGLNELIKSGKIDQLIEGFHAAEETKAVEKILVGVSNGLSAIGFEEVKKAIDSGAVDELVVHEKMLSEKREETEQILDKAEQLHGKIIFISGKNEAGEKILGFGGIAAVLRYKSDWK
ncbi:MAG: mRNA surveillance protein pelota [Candidatus Diapherotrites archaeon]|uniref:Protein pelota homolog n=1 Tax=Candidatus Iainarchaeum sp. TaxID=3101447 RepID=A0A2D6LQ93_9ARCH|nr:mRNA surveillance protein pelota [Candidatus Diapherotrites archaeon]|tara:strand:+ start:187 stop:1227 length:1041 start_codon:yes stop_codon:yes gene_type:complete